MTAHRYGALLKPFLFCSGKRETVSNFRREKRFLSEYCAVFWFVSGVVVTLFSNVELTSLEWSHPATPAFLAYEDTFLV